MTEFDSNLTLGDVGERRIVTDILAPRYRKENVTFGDDVADFGNSGAGTLVATTDPAPEPAAWRFMERDFFDWGWLLGALNLSDIAASGAEPIGMLTSFTLPSETKVSEFLRLLDGVDAACKEVGTVVRGGNLKEASRPVVEGTALGVVDGRPLSRMGAEPGDLLYAFGDVGAYWGALLLAWDGATPVPGSFADTALRRPRPLISVGRELRATRLAKAAMDASDGLYATLVGLTVEQGLGFEFQPERLQFSPYVLEWARRANVDPVRLALGFGNLELVCAGSAADELRLRQIAKRNGVNLSPLGQVTAGDSVLEVGRNGKLIEMANFDNERFTVESQFTGGLDAYRDRLLSRSSGD